MVSLSIFHTDVFFHKGCCPIRNIFDCSNSALSVRSKMSDSEVPIFRAGRLYDNVEKYCGAR
jgi:hypothetical protein